MLLLDHISITVPRLDARPFYDAVMDALGASKVYDREDALATANAAARATPDTHLSVGRILARRQRRAPPLVLQGAQQKRRGPLPCRRLAHGGRDDGAPGLRPHYHPHYYAAFLLDPCGNRIEAVCHDPE